MPQLRGDRQKPVRGFRYIWDGDVIAEEIPLNADASLDMLRRAVWHFQPGSFAPLARESFADDNDNPVHLTHFVVTDHLGTPRELVSANGELTWAAEYWTWGGVRKSWKKPLPAYKTHGNTAYARKLEDEPVLCPIRFPGQWEDEESGLYYNRHRYYDPLSGGYLCPDPIGLAGGDRPQGYVACPNVWTDPLGLAASGTKKLWGPHEEGPLGNPNDPQTPASTFRSGSYTEEILVEPRTLYRAYGDKVPAKGRYWTEVPPRGPMQSQLDNALNPDWGNTATEVTSHTFPAGTTIYTGASGPQTINGGAGGLYGGGSQVFMNWSEINKAFPPP